MGPYINIMQHLKQSDNDTLVWRTENDNIIEKGRFFDVSTYVRCYYEKRWIVGDREA